MIEGMGDTDEEFLYYDPEGGTGEEGEISSLGTIDGNLVDSLTFSTARGQMLMIAHGEEDGEAAEVIAVGEQEIFETLDEGQGASIPGFAVATDDHLVWSYNPEDPGETGPAGVRVLDTSGEDVDALTHDSPDNEFRFQTPVTGSAGDLVYVHESNLNHFEAPGDESLTSYAVDASNASVAETFDDTVLAGASQPDDTFVRAGTAPVNELSEVFMVDASGDDDELVAVSGSEPGGTMVHLASFPGDPFVPFPAVPVMSELGLGPFRLMTEAHDLLAVDTENEGSGEVLFTGDQATLGLPVNGF